MMDRMAELPNVILWKWRVLNPETSRWRELTYRMTEEQAQQKAAREGVRLERIEGSAEERTPITTGWGQHVTPSPDRRRGGEETGTHPAIDQRKPPIRVGRKEVGKTPVSSR